MPPSDVYVRSFLYLLYFNKTLLHRSSGQSSLVTGPGLNSSPQEAKNAGVFHSSATTFQFSSVVTQSCPTICDPMDCRMPGFPVHHQLLEFTQTQVH